MSNFTFLITNWPDLYATAFEAEQNVASAPLRLRSGQALGHQTSCFYTRRSQEIAVKWLYANDSYLEKPHSDNAGLYRAWERICCENSSPAYDPANSRQTDSLFSVDAFFARTLGVYHNKPILQ